MRRMEPKHITLFVRHLPIGGIQKIVVRLANEFSQRGHNVDLVLARGEGPLACDVSPEVRLVNLDKQRVWGALPALLGYLWRERPTVLFSAGTAVNLVALWAKALLPLRLRAIISVHNNMTQYASNDKVRYGTYIPTLIRWFFPLADKIVAASEGVLQDLASISTPAARNACVVYNPVVEGELCRKADQSVTHPWLNERDVPVILGVGRLVPQKNFDLLFRAFTRVQETRDARLLVLGDGNQRGQLESQAKELGIEDKVDLPGFVRNPYPFMAKASLFVLSSDYEGFGIVLAEALACGCPVVSTNCPSGPREILEDGKWGRLVPVGDEEALAEAMCTSLAEEHDPERLRERAMDFSVDRVVDEYLEVLFPEE